MRNLAIFTETNARIHARAEEATASLARGYESLPKEKVAEVKRDQFYEKFKVSKTKRKLPESSSVTPHIKPLTGRRK